MALKEQLPTLPGGSAGRGPLQVGDEQYLWALVILEVVALFVLRSAFKRNHGG